MTTDSSKATADLCAEVAKIGDDFRDYASWPIELPAGHWRELAANAEPAAGAGDHAFDAMKEELERIVHDWDGEPEDMAGARAVLRLANGEPQ